MRWGDCFFGRRPDLPVSPTTFSIMSIRDQINDELKTAMRGGDAARRDALRLLTAALKQKEVDERKALQDPDVVAVIDKMIKQRRDSIAQFQQGGRSDLAEKEEFEIS